MTETEWWWIDYLENDLDPTTAADIEYLLNNSESDQDEFERWRLLRMWVQESDPAIRGGESWRSEELVAHKNRIMDAVNALEIPLQSSEVHLRLI